MPTFNIVEAKTQLSRLVERVERGIDAEIVIARNDRPVARLVALAAPPVQRRIGVAKGQFVAPDSIDLSHAEIECLMMGGAGRCGC
ncbi:MAG TPA: type II toxin-antitoxin system Phd/YefM family antitoxin [Lamprocystis sp. (in: g-proteobacteria)]|nr:type II toxin-antitoxin system Phd/YefM family antitoxin [Lamprocystis sp. (in: g-proteobacteria)]